MSPGIGSGESFMLASISALLGILLAVIVIIIARRSKPKGSGLSTVKSRTGWLCLTLGLVALAAFVIQTLPLFYDNNTGLPFSLISILFSAASVLIGIWTLVKHDRHWPTWVGLIAGTAPALFWIAFALGYVLGFD